MKAMRAFFRLTLSLVLLAALGGYVLWTQQRPTLHYLSDLRVYVALNQGQPSDRGNLLGIQPELVANDYQSLERLHRKFAAYLNAARDAGLLNSRTIVVLPEHIGTWLLAIHEKPQVYEALSFADASAWIAASRPLDFLQALTAASPRHRGQDARLRMKAQSMAHDYQQLFGRLALEYGVTLVAGSIVLPEPKIEAGQLFAGAGPLFNVSVVFGPDGAPLGQPQRQRRRGTAPWARNSPGDTLQVFDTAAGRLGILIGEDSQNAANYRELQDRHATLLAIPAFIAGLGSWDRVWQAKGQLAAATESTRGQIWRQTHLSALAPAPNMVGITVFAHGQLWDIDSDGTSFVSANGAASSLTTPGQKGAGLFNLWL